MAVTERPYKDNLSRNEIRYVFALGNMTNANPHLQVILQYTYYNAGISNWTDLYTFDLIPDGNGSVILAVQQWLDSVLQFETPDATQLITYTQKQFCYFRISFRELDDDNTDTAWDESEFALPRTVIKGGIEKLKHARNNFFINYHNTNKPPLTWNPSNGFVFLNQKVFLSYYFDVQLDEDSDLQVKYEFTDVQGNKSTYLENFTSYEQVVHVNASALNANFPALSNNLWYYDISIISRTTIMIKPAYRFYIEYRPLYDYCNLVWQNSLGGWNSVFVKGETGIGLERSFDEGGKGKDAALWNSFIKQGSALLTGLYKRNTYKGNLGFSNTKTGQESLEDLMVSQNIYMIENGYWMPVIAITKSADLRKNTDTLFPYAAEWQLAQDDESFTPRQKYFGQGNLNN